MERLLYFGHPINVYDTELEKFLLKRIALHFPGWRVENPNQPQHEEGYKRFMRDTGKGMDYYFQLVLPKCHGGVFLPFRDGKWGAGVYGEAEALAKRQCPIWEISCDGAIVPIAYLDKSRVLTVEETRARIRAADRAERMFIPY